MPGSPPRFLAVLGVVCVLLLAGCGNAVDDGDAGSPEPTEAEQAAVPDEGTEVAEDDVERLESFVAVLEQESLEVVDYGFASDGFVGLVYRHDESTAEADIEVVAESYSHVAATESWSPEELRVMTVDDEGEPATTYRIETAAARAYANDSITWDAYWTHVGSSYEEVDERTPTEMTTATDGGDGFEFPDEESPTPTGEGPPTAEEETPTATPTPEDDDGWSIFPDD